MTTEASGTNMNTKVARVIREYDLDGMGANLEAAWTGEAGERTSLRDLADEFNEAVLEAALRESGIRRSASTCRPRTRPCEANPGRRRHGRVAVSNAKASTSTS